MSAPTGFSGPVGILTGPIGEGVQVQDPANLEVFTCNICGALVRRLECLSHELHHDKLHDELNELWDKVGR